MKVTTTKIALVEKLLKEELRQAMTENSMRRAEQMTMAAASRVTEAEGEGELPQSTAKDDTVGGMAALVQSASTGNDSASAALQKSAGAVDIDGDLQKLQSALEKYGQTMTELEKGFGESLSAGGWDKLPAAQEMYKAMAQSNQHMRNVMQQGFEGVKKASAQLQDVQKDVKEKGDDLEKKGGTKTGSDTFKSGGGLGQPEAEGEKGESTFATMQKGLASVGQATGLFRETKNHRRQN